MAGFRHAILERNAVLLTVFIILTIAVGGIVEIAPLFISETTIERVDGVRPYSPLELAGRDIYIREGCYVCHSQQIRSLRDEVERYGHYSLAAESMYDHPFQWGSKRNGPDLARVGGRFSNAWHYAHLVDPRSVVPESIMPRYGFMENQPLNYRHIVKNMEALRTVGVPYSDDMIANALKDIEAQAQISSDETDDLMKRYPKAVLTGGNGFKNVTELDALVAYLQVLGTGIDFVNVSQEQLKQ